MDKSSGHTAFQSSGGISADARRRPAEEVKHRTGQDDGNRDPGLAHKRQHGQSDNTAHERTEESNQHRVGRKGKYRRTVQRRFCIRHQLFGNSLKGGNHFVDQHTHAGEHDIDPCGKGDRLNDGVQNPVITGEDLRGCLRAGKYGYAGNDNVAQKHRQRNGYGIFTKEGQSLGETNILRCRRLFITPEQLADLGAQPIAAASKMPESQGIVSNDFAHGRLHQRREDCHDKPHEKRPCEDQRRSLKPRDGHKDRHQAGHIQGMMSC